MKWILNIMIKNGQPATYIEGVDQVIPRNVRGCLKGVSDLIIISDLITISII